MLNLLPKIVFAFAYKPYQKRNISKINKFNFKGTATIATVGLTFSLFSANSVNAANFTFSQEGWQYGGNLSGSFTGDDLNSDGKIETSELSAFTAIFSGTLVGRIPLSGGLVTKFAIISHSLPSFTPEPDLIESLFFNYLISTSNLSFSSSKASCLLIGPPPLRCFILTSASSISASNTGGTVNLGISFPSPGLPNIGVGVGTQSSLPLVVTTTQQTIPEPSTLKVFLLGSLASLLRKKILFSRTTKQTTDLNYKKQS
jgi:hypothetical protein